MNDSVSECVRLKTPVVLFIFNRPETTEKVFEVIRKVRPRHFFVVADGAREDRINELEKCQATRAIIDGVDWECEIFRNYSDKNLGCAKRVSSGLDWVFDHVQEAIILEDDCVPDPSFFQFCEELLERYRYDDRIMSISGQNVQFGRKYDNYSYYFSLYNHCWGWATWKRAWQYYDLDIKLWPEIRSQKLLESFFDSHEAVSYWSSIFQDVYEHRIDTWDFSWTFTCWVQNGLSILSNENLVSNIGFGLNSTHTTNEEDVFSNIPAESMTFPLRHPPYIMRNVYADRFTQKTLFKRSLLSKIKRLVKSQLGVNSMEDIFKRK